MHRNNSQIIHVSCHNSVTGVSDGAKAAYEAPFPEERFKVSARVFPLLIPAQPDNPGVATAKEGWEKLSTFEKPFLTAYGDSDPISRGGEKSYQDAVPGARGLNHLILEGAGHFIQEDKSAELVEIITEFIAAG